MDIFVISLTRPNPTVRQKVMAFTHCYIYSETTFFVASKGKLTEEIANLSGIHGPDRASNSSGVVTKLNGSYSGYTNVDLWEWLERMTKEFA